MAPQEEQSPASLVTRVLWGSHDGRRGPTPSSCPLTPTCASSAHQWTLLCPCLHLGVANDFVHQPSGTAVSLFLSIRETSDVIHLPWGGHSPTLWDAVLANCPCCDEMPGRSNLREDRKHLFCLCLRVLLLWSQDTMTAAILTKEKI